jgi:hypothetical protein
MMSDPTVLHAMYLALARYFSRRSLDKMHDDDTVIVAEPWRRWRLARLLQRVKRPGKAGVGFGTVSPDPR